MKDKKYGKAKDGSYIHNCVIHRREDDPAPFMFGTTIGYDGITVHLNGYAIIPISEYELLTGKETGAVLKIHEADEELFTQTGKV